MSLDDEPDATRLAAALSPERLGPYLRTTGGDLTAALRLYEWNLALSGALYEALGIVEVVLRNALSVQLTAHHGTLAGRWYDDPLDVLSAPAHGDIAAARGRVRKLHRAETPGRVVAELNFGFWKFLLAKRYEATLWTGYLRHAFPDLQPQSRATVYRALDELHTVRNRIAHHEPIHSRDSAADMLTIYRLLDWIDADVRAWAVTLSRCSRSSPHVRADTTRAAKSEQQRATPRRGGSRVLPRRYSVHAASRYTPNRYVGEDMSSGSAGTSATCCSPVPSPLRAVQVASPGPTVNG